MLKMLKDSRIKNSEKYSLILEFDKSLGLGLDKLKIGPIPKNILSLAEERENYRKIKDWKSADEVRDKIKKLGYKIGDSASGYTLTK